MVYPHRVGRKFYCLQLLLLHFYTLTWHWYVLSLINYGQKAFILLAFFFP